MKRILGPWRFLWSAPDIRRKLLITLALLVLYRLVSHVPVPGVDRTLVEQLFNSGNSAGATLLATINLISGGTLSRFSVLGMGVYPYITAQIIIQLLVPLVPAWQAKMEDDPRGYRQWMERTTLYFSVAMAFLNAIGQINIMNLVSENMFGEGVKIVSDFSIVDNFLPSITILISMTAGTMFAIWLGELISEFGIRNQGLSLIIFAGIIAQMPSTYIQIWQSAGTARIYAMISILIITALTIFAIVVVQQGRRKIPVMYPGRRMGNRMSMPVKGSLPLMVNMAGMIPLIFAQAILSFPGILGGFFLASENETIARIATAATNFQATSWGYQIFYFFMVVLFTFFYADVLFQQQNYGDNLKRSGAKVGNVRAGAATQEYLNKVLRRITLPGALFLGLIAILPFLITLLPIMQPVVASQGGIAYLINSSGLLIVVGVVRDTFFNIDAELKLHGYDESLLVK